MMMPVMDGPATVLALRQIDPKIKIIAASGLSANSRHAVKVGHRRNEALLAKPYTTGTMLLNTIRRGLDGGELLIIATAVRVDTLVCKP